MTKPNSVKLERVFNAPVDLVWRMWTEPEHFQQWYGPGGMRVPVARMELRVGGIRHICMESVKSGMRMWTVGAFVEITTNHRLVYTESISDEEGNIIPPSQMGMPEGYPETTRVTLLFEALDGQTKLTLTHEGIPQQSPGARGWSMALDALASHVNALL